MNLDSKVRNVFVIRCTAVAMLACSGMASANTTYGDLSPRPGEDGGGVTYAVQMNMEGHPESVSGSVGSRAWGEGWTHTAIWAYISVPSDGTYQVSLSPNASDLVPALSLYQGVDNSGTDDHTFNPTASAPHWADAPGFSLLEYRSGPNEGSSAAITRHLAAGEYTVALGGNDFTTEGHLAGFTYSVAPVPVPAALYLFGSGVTGLIAAAKRRRPMETAARPTEAAALC